MKPDAELHFREFCQHIVEWGERIPVYVGEMSYEEFAEDDLTHTAVWKCVDVLGEASAKILRIDPALADRYPELQLKSAYAMRNRLTHGYSDVDLKILWSTIQDFVPSTVAAAKAIVNSPTLR